MNWLFKIFGLLIVFLVCVALGSLKSLLLKQEAEELKYYKNSLDILAERILREKGEITEILPKSFKKANVYIKNGRIFAKTENLNKENKAMLSEFLEGFGELDVKGEYERTRLYCSLFEKEAEVKEKSCKEESKLYKSLGVLGGIFICIILV